MKNTAQVGYPSSTETFIIEEVMGDTPIEAGPNSGPGPHTGATKKKRDEKKSKRDPRAWENLSKSLANHTNEEKWLITADKYKELHSELRTTIYNFSNLEKKINALEKEKTHLQNELSKSIFGRSKIESVARELQKQNKDAKEENYNRMKEEEEKRKMVAANFTEKLNTLTTLMDENRDKSVRLREENLSMTNKLTELYNQFQEREASLANMNRQMELQKKLSDTQLKKLEIEYESEKEMWNKERAMLISNLRKSEEANSLLQENVNNLQSNLAVYQNQYTEFETTMQRSTLALDSFKQEMDRVQKSNISLLKDREIYQNRLQNATQTIVRLTEMLENIKRDSLDHERRKIMLEKLCRKLQTERAAYINQLKENNITPITPSDEDEIPREVEVPAQAPAVMNLPEGRQEQASQGGQNVNGVQDRLREPETLDNSEPVNNIGEHFEGVHVSESAEDAASLLPECDIPKSESGDSVEAQHGSDEPEASASQEDKD